MTIIPFYISFTLAALVGLTLLAVWKLFSPFYQKSHFPYKSAALITLLLLITVQSIMATQGFLASTIGNIPPPMGISIILLTGLVLYLAMSYTPFQTLQKTDTINLALLQTFRLPLELIFLWLLKYEAIPVEMTFEGRNPDLLIGLSAPLVALAVQRNWMPLKALLIWNIAGLLFLINIMSVAILCLPTPFRVFFDSIPNEFVLYFPFNLIPSVFVMLAFFLHILSIKILLRK